MTTRINVYLTFKDNCEEAMNFYQQCLGGELTLHKVEGTPAEAQCPPEMKNKIMHANLIHNDLILMASDMLWPGELEHGNSVSLSLNCSSEEEIKTYFSKLSEGGKIVSPLKDEFWGALFGMVTDKFGVRWLFNFERNPQN